MTNNIGTVPVGSIQNISLTSSSENEEIDLVEEDGNIVVVGNDEGVDVSIECILTKEVHPSSADVEEQRDNVKTLVPRSALENDFVYKEYKGWLVVESVSVPETSDSQGLKDAKITGQFVPWPKQYSDEGPPKNYQFASAEMTIDVNWAGDIDLSRVWGLDSSGSFGNAFGVEFNRDWKCISINLFMEGDLEIQ